MKKITITLFALMYIIFANAQEFKSLKTDLSQKEFLSQENTYKKVRDLIYVQDSSKRFSYNDVTEEWEPTLRQKVVQRFSNGKSKTEESSKITSSSGYKSTWENRNRYELFYDDSYTNIYMIDGFLSNSWNSNTDSWQSDTTIYINFTKYSDIWDILGTGYLHEDRIVNKDWDYLTNKYTDGQKIEITLHDDSLYSDLLYVNYDIASQSWGNIDKEYLFDYNEDNNISYFLGKKWNTTSSNLENNFQTFITYAGNNAIQSIQQSWDGVIWENNFKMTFDYDGNNNIILQEQYDWDDINLEWVYYDRIEFTYDSNNNKTSETIINWNSTTESLVNSEKNIFSFDNNSNKLSEALLFWDSSINNWVNDDSTYYTYDANNNMLSNTYKKWDGTNDEWNFISKNEVSYDVNSNKLSDTDLEWDDATSDWVYVSRTVYFYNELNELYLEIYQQWDNSKSTWENIEREVYIFDENDNLIQYLYQTWDETIGDWKNDNKTEYYWNEFDATITDEISSCYFNIYPNPTSDFINVSNTKNNISSITITNIAGKVVYENKKLKSKNNIIHMKQYGAGIYIISVKDISGNEMNSKILVK